jgi:hypothetical protein
LIWFGREKRAASAVLRGAKIHAEVGTDARPVTLQLAYHRALHDFSESGQKMYSFNRTRKFFVFPLARGARPALR